jgi:hypothetical protein
MTPETVELMRAASAAAGVAATANRENSLRLSMA